MVQPSENLELIDETELFFLVHLGFGYLLDCACLVHLFLECFVDCSEPSFAYLVYEGVVVVDGGLLHDDEFGGVDLDEVEVGFFEGLISLCTF